MLIKETNEKDLGTLKATVKLGRKELYSFLNEIVESQKISSSHQ
jgi:hypothetical protein